jgi:hypothetical protein
MSATASSGGTGSGSRPANGYAIVITATTMQASLSALMPLCPRRFGSRYVATTEMRPRVMRHDKELRLRRAESSRYFRVAVAGEPQKLWTVFHDGTKGRWNFSMEL